ncbi:hypothetical protein MANES_02G118900v8 [Manihot esculenta]|uniref:Uncharacterized protein n=1 Tax=Manihot esculenta TaxID=3983 RepID=A0ACB7I739_MANES|nr:hypothetical protein MANES_02G118900v8 [Manihot esculenta]
MSTKQSFRVCFCFRRIFKLRVLEPPRDVKNLFDQYSQNGTMSLDDLLRFLIEFQGEENATKNDAQAIFNSLKHLNIFQRRGLQLEAFFRYLMSDLNAALSPSTGVHQDMNAPLAHYFMFTGHNSYLTGNQLSSDSSVEPIINALKRGVRVIELDLWPNSKKDDVEVRHGGTLTSPVDLAKCLLAIKENAFCASEYPVVITFEDHLTPDLQSKVAKDLPHQEEHIPDEDEEKTVPEYRNLIAIHAGKLKGSLENWLHIDSDKVRRLSLSEQELENAARTNGTDIVRFTQRNLLRVYPKGVRLDSSNYNPHVGWMHGAQMVAFNMQGYGKHLWVMQGMFKANGGCGYVRKPDFLLQLGPNNKVFDPTEKLPVKTILQVKVFMGEGWDLDFRRTHFDLYSPPDFFVKLAIAGAPEDKAKKKTRVIEDDWLPEWNEMFQFPLTVPELAVLRIEVIEYDTSGNHDFGGQTCYPVSELRTGIRSVPLYSRRGELYKNVKLLMQFEFA